MTHKRVSDHIIAGRCYKFGAFLGALEANLIASSYKYSFCIFFFALFCVGFFFFFSSCLVTERCFCFLTLKTNIINWNSLSNGSILGLSLMKMKS